MTGYPDYPGCPGVHCEFPGDTRDTDRMLEAMHMNRVQLMERVLSNYKGKVVSPALFHLECGDILKAFRLAGIWVIEDVDVIAAVQCFVARHLSDMLPCAEWLQGYLDFKHLDELGKLTGNDL